MDHIEHLANLKHQLSLEVHKLEQATEDTTQVKIMIGYYIQIEEKHNRIWKMEKEMEDTINDCIDVVIAEWNDH